jgi:UDP-N-acetylmuramate dehydrogenase
MVRLSDYTTFGIGGEAKTFVVASSEEEIIDAVEDADDRRDRVLILSGGSNMLISDAGFDGTVVQIASKGVDADVSACGGAIVNVAAGEVWDEFVAFALAKGWLGVEALSGIPGLVGAAPVQNIGAYSQEVGDTVEQVRTFDRVTRSIVTFTNQTCGFGYRTSEFKRSVRAGEASGRYVVLRVTFQFRLGTLAAPVAYAELANYLGVQLGDRVDARRVGEAVLAIRASKSMVYAPDDLDSHSAGSFFTNPYVSAETAATLPVDAPQFALADGSVKTSAAWLIEHAGFGKGFALPDGSGRAALSSKHVLALTNRGGATSAEVLELAHAIQAGVQEHFGVQLEPEPVIVA